MQAQKGDGDLVSTQREVGGQLWRLYTGIKTVPILQEDETGRRSWAGGHGKPHPSGIRSSNPPACSESLYRLHSSGSRKMRTIFFP